MLIEELCRYADKRMELPPPGYRKQAIYYVIDLDDAGTLGSVNTTGQRGRKAGPPLERFAPYLKRSGTKAPPQLLADVGGRSLGLPYKEGKEDWCLQRHKEYVALIEQCAEETAEPTVRAVAQFLHRHAGTSNWLPADFNLDALLTFRVAGTFPSDLSTVRSFWARKTGFAGDGPLGTCAVCGSYRHIARIHPLKIRGLPGESAFGADVVSADKESGWSYGLAQSFIFPTCHECAWKYSNALNLLIKEPESHYRVETRHNRRTKVRPKGKEFLFWTIEPTDFKPLSFLDDPNPSDIAEMLKSPISAAAAATDVDDQSFYAVSLNARQSRVCVHSFLSSTVADVKKRLIHYFALQAIEGSDGSPSGPIGLWRLANALYFRDTDKDLMVRAADSLFTMAIAGCPLPQAMLSAAVQQCRATQHVSRERAALIKMALGSRDHWSPERMHAMSGLDAGNQDPAYLCGRLLAELNEIQRQALGQTNATVIDKFYGSASSAPASVFGNLLDNARNHLSKLSKAGNKGQGAANALDRSLEEIMDGLGAFPKTLTMPEQAMFALGFYHQRAANRRAIRERIEARNAANAPDDAASESDAA